MMSAGPSTEARRLSILDQRRIEAGIAGPIYEALTARVGAEEAQAIIAEAIRSIAREAGRAFAAQEKEGTDLLTFATLFELWREGNAYEMELLISDERNFDFNIKRCRYSEMYHELGLKSIGHLLSCERDGNFCTGYDPRIRMTRTQTLMEGASHCDFRFRYNEQDAPASDPQAS